VGAMTTMQLAQHLATGHVESGEQTGGALPFVVVSVRRSICPGRMGSNGAVRSSA
jgi:hypothetical protein